MSLLKWQKFGYSSKKSNLYFNLVYQLQETRAIRALGRLDLRRKVPPEAWESSKEIEISFLCTRIMVDSLLTHGGMLVTVDQRVYHRSTTDLWSYRGN